MKKIILLSAFVLFVQFCFAQVERIVSLAPSLTEQLYLLGAQKKLVGCTSYCQSAKEDDIAVVSTAIDVNIERVVKMKPQLVITSSLTKPSTINTFKKLGIKVKVYPYPKSYEDLNSQFLELAKLVDFESEGKQIVNREKARLNAALKNVPNGKSHKIFMEIGAKPLFTVVPNTFMHDYIKMVGGVNIANHLTIGSISREAVLMRNPDVIFVVTMGIVGQEEKKRWKSYTQLNAAKSGNVFVIDSNVASTPTPHNFVETVLEMIRLLYPKS